MPRPPFARGAAPIAAALVAMLVSAPAAGAQSAGDGFLFHPPVGALTLHVGANRATASSQVFDFSRQRLTLGPNAFTGVNVGADLSVALAGQLDLVLSAAFARSSADTHFRDFVDTDDREIEQTTRFERTPLTATLRAYLTPRGRTIGHYAWIPNKVAPYVGAGGGAMYYRFQQDGDFVDEETFDVFPATLESTGWAPMAQAMAGIDVSLSPRLALNTEARYGWARAKMGSDFSDFDRIDLSGFGVTAGLSIRF